MLKQIIGLFLLLFTLTLHAGTKEDYDKVDKEITDGASFTFTQVGPKEYTLILTKFIGHVSFYKDVLKKIEGMDGTYTINIVGDRNNGGYHDGGFTLINYFKWKNIKTIFYVRGPNQSMAAMLACNSEQVIFEERSFLMFHSGVDENGIMKRNKEYLAKCTYYLTEEDIEKINNKMEMYYYPDGTKIFLPDQRFIEEHP